MGRKMSVVVAAFAAALLLAILAAATFLWNDLGPDRISPAGWAAMILGALFALFLGIGLVSLMYFSHRRGYDEGREK